MGTSRRRFRFASTLLAVAAGLASSTAPAQSGSGRPRIVSGAGKTSSGVFTASAAGAVFELPSHALLRVAPNATLRVFPVPQELQLTPGAKTTTWSLALTSGRVDVEMPSTAKGAVLASIGKLSALVTKGRVALLASSDSATVANVEGQVTTMLSDRWQTVETGWVATLSRDNPSATEKPGVAVPTLNGGQRMFFAATETIAPRGFHWAQVAGAQHYDLRVRRLSDGKLMDLRHPLRNEWADALMPLEAGRYGLTLRAVDARGIESRWSPEAELRVIGVVLQPGSYSDEHAVFLGIGQEVRFTNVSGLEMTYVGAGRYFPAPSSVTLYRNKTTVLGFRLPGTQETASARLEPRAVYADVRINPKRAVWPRDTVSIDIQLKSKTGAEIPAFLQVVPKVSLGLEPVRVNFEQKAGNILHGVVPPSAMPGPWVLRVDVADQYGVVLGHDFLEIAAQAPTNSPAVHIVRSAGNTQSSPTPQRPPAPEPTVASSY